MELTVSERLVILSILPIENDITTLRILQELKKNLSFNEEEHRQLEFKQDGDKVTWNEVDIKKDVEIGETAENIIRNAFRDLNNKKKLREEHIPLYEAFVEEK